MKKKYEFPVYSTVVPPQVAFQLVYADGSKSMSFTPDRWEAEKCHSTQKVVGWVPARAEITFTPEEGKWYLVRRLDDVLDNTYAMLFCQGRFRHYKTSNVSYNIKDVKIIAEMKEAE